MTSIRQQRSSSASLLFLLACLACVYIVPYHVPVAPNGVSEAFAFGWNTRAGLLVLLACACSFAVFTKGLGMVLPPTQDVAAPLPITRRLLYGTLAVTAVCCLLVWVWVRRNSSIAESAYFLSVYNSHYLGGRLYKTYGFYYGPLMFYPAVWINRLLPSLSTGDAYFASWTIQFTLGMGLFWKTMQQLVQTRRRAFLTYALIGIPLFLMINAAGLNYTPLRFVLCPLIALLVDREYRRGCDLYRLFAWASFGGLLLLLYSPESGIQFLVGTLLFFGLCVRPWRKGMPEAILVFSAIMLAGTLVCYRLGEFDLAIKMGNGGLAFPLLFGYLTLVPVLLIFLGACVVVAAQHNRQTDHPLVYLVLLALASSPAAMGRCDPGHILVNTFGAFVASVFVLVQYGKPFQWLTGALLSFEALIGFGNLVAVQRMISESLRREIAITGGRSGSESLAVKLYVRLKNKDALKAALPAWRSQLLEPSQGRQIPVGSMLFAPLGGAVVYDPADFPVRINTGYHPSAMLLYPTILQDKVTELKESHDALVILPNDWAEECEWKPGQLRQMMHSIFGPSYVPTVRHPPIHLEPMCVYLNQHYEQSDYAAPMRGTTVLQPKLKPVTLPTFSK